MYDTLVYALGAVPDTAAVPGAHAHTLGGAQDAALPASRLGELDERPGAGAVVVCGNGLTWWSPRPRSPSS